MRPSAGKARSATMLTAQLAAAQAVARRARSTIRFFRTHPELLRSPRTRPIALRALRQAERRLARSTRTVRRLRNAILSREQEQLRALPPRKAICRVFGRYCSQALEVAWCESRLLPSARNGEYLGLFQMGGTERRLFGHGPTPYEQARAAYRYFVRSGRDWSPWGCRWAAL
ncbi:MAG: hypothetical protein RMM28_04615 [Thermoleophilia bacterium]|nr:hypothetical protein [Gaiellaceae bacterium]MDW8338405.1 hypothetical protein [Thermoleophilia bacterium]